MAKVVGSFVGSSSEAVTPADALRARIAAQEEEMKKLRRELDAGSDEGCFFFVVGCWLVGC